MILIIDDVEDDAKILCTLLGHFGYACRRMATGDATLTRIRDDFKNQPLLIVLTDQAPRMNGIDFLSAIRRDKQICHTPVVMYGSGMDAAQRKHAKLLGIEAWLTKGSLRGIDDIVKAVMEAYEKAGGAKLVTRGNGAAGA